MIHKRRFLFLGLALLPALTFILASTVVARTTFETEDRGRLTIVKLTEGGDNAFRFESASLPASTFTLTTSSGTAAGVFTDLVSGTYDITEVPPIG